MKTKIFNIELLRSLTTRYIFKPINARFLRQPIIYLQNILEI